MRCRLTRAKHRGRSRGWRAKSLKIGKSNALPWGPRLAIPILFVRRGSGATEEVGGACVNAQYNVASPGSLPAMIAGYQRRKMYDLFLGLGVLPEDTILDVGATSDQSYDHSNYLEAWYPHKSKITAVGLDDGAAFLEAVWPGVRFTKADGRNLPYREGSFDYVHSSAVLEHVGGRSQQLAFISESIRVARKGVFLTTPNRWFPIEFHTLLPLVHWLPASLSRQLLTQIGREFFADEQNLNLLSSNDILRLAREFNSRGNFELLRVRLLGWTSNLIFTFRKHRSDVLKGSDSDERPLVDDPFMIPRARHGA